MCEENRKMKRDTLMFASMIIVGEILKIFVENRV